MQEGVVETHDVVLILRVPLLVEQLKDSNLGPGLLEIGRMILDDFDGDNVVCAHVLALDHLAKSALAEHVENQVFVTIVRAEPVVDIQNEVMVFIIVALVVSRLSGFG